MTIDLTLACHEYDWTEPLWTGAVKPEGVDLTTVDYKNPELWTRMLDHGEFDACEMSVGTYLATQRGPEPSPVTAIPVFPYRKFRHAYIYVREDAGIETPADLEGAAAAVVNWQTTTGIWQRGILADEYDVDPKTIRWKSAKPEIAPVETPSYDVDYLDRPGRARHVVEAMLDDGEVDAVFHPKRLQVDNGRPLFDDPVAVEREYYSETGIFPIMHTLVIDDDLLESEPWITQKLFDAFEAAKRLGLQELDRPYGSAIVWSEIFVERQRALLGDDPWEYGLTERNRHVLETLIGYAHDQEIVPERYPVDSLFALEALDASRY